ncbi:MAG TPA: hypothetical protein VGJ32_02265 [Solirubrobacteraceae bacterium]|jgi:hypothetical protein
MDTPDYAMTLLRLACLVVGLGLAGTGCALLRVCGSRDDASWSVAVFLAAVWLLGLGTDLL